MFVSVTIGCVTEGRDRNALNTRHSAPTCTDAGRLSMVMICGRLRICRRLASCRARTKIPTDSLAADKNQATVSQRGVGSAGSKVAQTLTTDVLTLCAWRGCRVRLNGAGIEYW